MASRLISVAEAAKQSGRNPGRTENYIGVLNKHGHRSGKRFLDYSILDQPKRWKTPYIIFVNSMSDLFQDGVPFEFVQAFFEMMLDSSLKAFSAEVNAGISS